MAIGSYSTAQPITKNGYLKAPTESLIKKNKHRNSFSPTRGIDFHQNLQYDTDLQISIPNDDRLRLPQRDSVATATQSRLKKQIKWLERINPPCSNLPFGRCGIAFGVWESISREYTNGSIEGRPPLGTPTPLAKQPVWTARRRQPSRRHYIGSSRNLHTYTTRRLLGTTLSRGIPLTERGWLPFGGKFDNLPCLKLNEISLLPGGAYLGRLACADALACQTAAQQIPHTNIPANWGFSGQAVAHCSGWQMTRPGRVMFCVRRAVRSRWIHLC